MRLVALPKTKKGIDLQLCMTNAPWTIELESIRQFEFALDLFSALRRRLSTFRNGIETIAIGDE